MLKLLLRNGPKLNLLGTCESFIEVHLSKVLAREPSRHPSYLSNIVAGVIRDLGTQGYELALYTARHLATPRR